jgi:hypothetical protein
MQRQRRRRRKMLERRQRRRRMKMQRRRPRQRWIRRVPPGFLRVAASRAWAPACSEAASTAASRRTGALASSTSRPVQAHAPILAPRQRGARLQVAARPALPRRWPLRSRSRFPLVCGSLDRRSAPARGEAGERRCRAAGPPLLPGRPRWAGAVQVHWAALGARSAARSRSAQVERGQG